MSTRHPFGSKGIIVKFAPMGLTPPPARRFRGASPPRVGRLAALGGAGPRHSFAPSWRTVIGKAHQEASALRSWLDFLFKPFIQHMMEAYMGQHGGHDAALHDPCLGMTHDPFFQDPGAQPLPHEAPYAPIMDSLTQSLAQASPVNAVEVSTDICLHDPADGVPHAPLTELVQCVMGTASPPEAIGFPIVIAKFWRLRHDPAVPAAASCPADPLLTLSFGNSTACQRYIAVACGA